MGAIMDDKKIVNNQNVKEISIWKMKHTPLKERKSSSGLTFRCKEVAVNEQKHTKLH